MTIRVVKEPPGMKLVEFTCERCKAGHEASAFAGRLVYGRGDQAFREFTCLRCGGFISVDAKEFEVTL